MNVTITCEGLHCGHCDASVESALLKVPGVSDADANHETNVVEVECAESVSHKDLKAAVEGAGNFTVLNIANA